MFEVVGEGQRRMGPRMLAELLEALAQLAEEAPTVLVLTARKLGAVFTGEAEREETRRREARAEVLEMLRAHHDAHLAAAAAPKAAAC